MSTNALTRERAGRKPRYAREDLRTAARKLKALNELGASKMNLGTVRESIGPDLFDHVITTEINARVLRPFEDPKFEEWKKIVTESDDPDLQTQIGVRLGGLGDELKPFPGRFGETDIPPEEKVDYSVSIYGEIFGLDFETETNDRLKALMSFGDELGQKYSRGFLKEIFVTMLQDNPTIYDSNSLFDSTNHDNDLDNGGAGKELNYANLQAAWEKLAGQTKLDGTPVPTEGFYIVCGTPNIMAAEDYAENPNNPDNANESRNTLKKRIRGVIWHRYLGNDWYIVAPREEVPGLHVGFLKPWGRKPLVDTQSDQSDERFRTMKKNWRVRYAFGLVWQEYRGVVRGSQNV